MSDWTLQNYANNISSWSSRSIDWKGLIYGNGFYVMISNNKYLVSTDGTSYYSYGPMYGDGSRVWNSVTYGNGYYVAVGPNSDSRVTWTYGIPATGSTWNNQRGSVPTANFQSVTFGTISGTGYFVAVSTTSGVPVMMSTYPETGINAGATNGGWTKSVGGKTLGIDGSWKCVTYGNGKFVAVGNDFSTGNSMTMYTTDITNWYSGTIKDSSGNTTTSSNTLSSVAYGNNLFVAVANSGSNNRIMTSSDGINWTLRTSPTDSSSTQYNWSSITFGNNVFVAVASSGTSKRSMISSNGIDWVLKTDPVYSGQSNIAWAYVAYGNNKFIAVGPVKTSIMTGYFDASMAVVYNAPCFVGSTKVTMSDGSFKQIKDIKQGDCVLENKQTGKTNIVRNLTEFTVLFDSYTIPKGLLGNSDEIICSNHPIWCNGGTNRIWASNIKGVTESKRIDTIYDIQYEDEGTFYAENILVDSLSPNFGPIKLPKSLYIHPEKYTHHLMDGEDDPTRNKPLMINDCDNYSGN